MSLWNFYLPIWIKASTYDSDKSYLPTFFRHVHKNVSPIWSKSIAIKKILAISSIFYQCLPYLTPLSDIGNTAVIHDEPPIYYSHVDVVL